MKNLLSSSLALLTIASLLLAAPVRAQQASVSPNYAIQSDSINFAGGLATSTNYGVQDSLGESGSGQGLSLSYSGLLGYQFMQLDIVAPLITPNLSATGISSSEAELTWGAAFDDFGVDQYYIYKDGVRVAGVASFPRDYVSSGLSANTTYAYNVSAVDAAGHEGPWSATTTATTLATAQRNGGGGGGTTLSDLYMSNFQTASNDVNAIVSFKTYGAVVADIYWGKDLKYSSGHLKDTANTYHYFLLGPLTPKTLYNVKIVLTDGRGLSAVYDNISFQTLSAAISGGVVNAADFEASSTASSIDLSWKLPGDTHIVGARLVKKEGSYPTSPTDGEILFESADGSKNGSFIDARVKDSTTYYYALFAKDMAGNFSSGLLANGRLPKAGEPVPASPLETLTPATNVDPKIEALTMKDFLFIQSGDSVPVDGSFVAITGDKATTVVLKYYKVPPILKTIAVTLVTREANPKHFTFILRANLDKTRYEATIASLGSPKAIAQNYTLRIDIVDFKDQGLKTLKGTLSVRAPVVSPVGFGSGAKKAVGYSFGLLLMLALAYFLKRKFFGSKFLKSDPWALLKNQ